MASAVIEALHVETAPPPPAIDVDGGDLASGSTTWTALPDLGETTFSAADSRRELDYMHARYRSPLTSRFLSTDPILGTPGSPQSWNRYAYTRGNPLKFTDPDGRSILHYIRAKWELAASNAAANISPVAGAAADVTPILGDGKAIYEAYKNPTALNIAAAAVGLAPGLGDAASKGLKVGANLVEGAVGTWGKSKTLAGHLARHGADFGAQSADDYARQAVAFFRSSQSSGLPTKVGSDGVIRTYDSATNTFGAFNPDGTTRTFYKPDPAVHGYATNLDYWEAQPGVSP